MLFLCALEKRIPILCLRPRREVVEGNVGELAAKRCAIDREADAIEPLVHLGAVLSHALADDVQWDVEIGEGAPGDSREDRDDVVARELVASEVEALACEAAWLLEDANGDGPDVGDGELREFSRRWERHRVDALRELLLSEIEVLHEEGGREDRGAYAELSDVLFDLVLAVEVRNTGLSIRVGDRGEDEMYASGLGRVCGGDALSRFRLGASLEWRRHREEGGRSFERLHKSGRVFDRRADERDALACELSRLRGVGTACDRANPVAALEQALHHSATLLACGSGDDDDKLLIHDRASCPLQHTHSERGETGAGRGILDPMNGTIEVGSVELFVRVAELRSFRGAGQALGVPRSTVSRRIAELESALGTRLFHRTTRHVALTSAGKTYLGACGPAIETIVEAGRALATTSENTAGRLRVTAPVMLAETVLGEVLAEYLARHPQMQLELVLTDRHVDLVEEKFDLAFRSGALKDSSVVARELGRGQLRCFASREYLRDRGTPASPRDLRRHACILFTPFAPRGRWVFRSRGRAMEVPVRGRLIVNSIPLAIDAAARGLGIARLPEATITEGLAANQLVEVLEAYAPPARALYAVYASGGRVSPAARVFLEIAKSHLERLGWQPAVTRE